MSAACTASRHGTASAYRRQGCRCPDAVEAVRAWWREKCRRYYAAGYQRPYYPQPRSVDEMAVERACGGDRRVKLTAADRAEAVARLTRLGLSARQISERIGVAERSVVRIRRALREEVPVST